MFPLRLASFFRMKGNHYVCSKKKTLKLLLVAKLVISLLGRSDTLSGEQCLPLLKGSKLFPCSVDLFSGGWEGGRGIRTEAKSQRSCLHCTTNKSMKGIGLLVSKQEVTNKQTQ